MQRACFCPSAPIRSHRGVALVIALLVLGVISGLATLLANEFALTLRRSQNLLRSEQAWEYLLGAEQLAALLIASDTEPERDHLGETWAEGMQAYPIDDGWLRGEFEDLQGRFNINVLKRQVAEDKVAPPVPNTEYERRFMRLLLAVGGGDVDESMARGLTESLLDWLDEDIEETGFGGAEDNAYSKRGPPYRPTNGPALSVSELRLLEGMTPELYKALAPHVTTWPVAGAGININTATPPVLAALAPGGLTPLAEGAVNGLLEARGEEGYEDLATFRDLPAWQEEAPTEGLEVRSDWFLLRTEVEYQGLFWQMQSVLGRRGTDIRVMARALGEL